MTLDVQHHGRVAVLAVGGDVDVDQAPRLRHCLLSTLAGRVGVVVDLAEVGRMDSAGLASLVEAVETARKNGRGFALAGVPGTVRRLLDLERLDTVFAIHPAVADAVKSLG